MAAAGERRALRDVAVRRLATLAAEGPVSREQVALVALGARVSDRTVWRWLAQVQQSASSARAHFVLDVAVPERLVFWRGNVTGVHRELVTAIAQLLGVSPGTLYNHIPDLREPRAAGRARAAAEDAARAARVAALPPDADHLTDADLPADRWH